MEKGLKLEPPDIEVYSKHKKSYDADLKYGDMRIHVKTQTKKSADRFGLSWMFQLAGITGGDGVIDKGGEYMIFLCLDMEKKNANIYGPYKSEDLIDLYKDPKLKKLRGIKACIYYEDIKDICPYSI